MAERLLDKAGSGDKKDKKRRKGGKEGAPPDGGDEAGEEGAGGSRARQNGRLNLPSSLLSLTMMAVVVACCCCCCWCGVGVGVEAAAAVVVLAVDDTELMRLEFCGCLCVVIVERAVFFSSRIGVGVSIVPGCPSFHPRPPPPCPCPYRCFHHIPITRLHASRRTRKKRKEKQNAQIINVINVYLHHLCRIPPPLSLSDPHSATSTRLLLQPPARSRAATPSATTVSGRCSSLRRSRWTRRARSMPGPTPPRSSPTRW